jgi:hypothetical protein
MISSLDIKYTILASFAVGIRNEPRGHPQRG